MKETQQHCVFSSEKVSSVMFICSGSFCGCLAEWDVAFYFFFSCCQFIIGYVDCWRPARFYFSLLFDARSKF